MTLPPDPSAPQDGLTAQPPPPLFGPDDLAALPEVLPAGPLIEQELPEAQPAGPPHPNFWWAVAWTVGFTTITQGIAGGVAGGYIIVAATIDPAGFRDQIGDPSNPFAILRSDLVVRAMAWAFAIDKTLELLIALVAIRLVVGRDWMRGLAVRRPSFAHAVLAALMLPAFLVLGDASYGAFKKVLPSIGDVMPNPPKPKPPATSPISDPSVGATQKAQSRGDEGGLMEEAMKAFGKWPLWLAVLLIGVGPAFAEELWCRGFLGRGLVGNYGPWGGVLLTSFFFGAMHVEPPQAAMAFLMGLCLHFVYLMTRSLWVPIGLHFANNTLAIFGLEEHAGRLTLFGVDPVALLENALAQRPAAMYGAAGFLMFATCLALYRSRVRLEPAAGVEPGTEWRPASPGVEFPPADSDTVVFRPLPGPLSSLLVLVAVTAFVLALSGQYLPALF